MTKEVITNGNPQMSFYVENETSFIDFLEEYFVKFSMNPKYSIERPILLPLDRNLFI